MCDQYKFCAGSSGLKGNFNLVVASPHYSSQEDCDDSRWLILLLKMTKWLEQIDSYKVGVLEPKI